MCALPSDSNLKSQPSETAFNVDQKYTVECATGYKPNSEDTVMTCKNTGKFDKDVKCIGEHSSMCYVEYNIDANNCLSYIYPIHNINLLLSVLKYYSDYVHTTIRFEPEV